jgi:hypothetical protein
MWFTSKAFDQLHVALADMTLKCVTTECLIGREIVA